MRIFVNKKNIAHIYDMINKYFKDGSYDIDTHTKYYIDNKLYKDNKSERSFLLEVYNSTFDLNNCNISINIHSPELTITMNIYHGTKIELKGTTLIISIPFEDYSAYGTVAKFTRLPSSIIEKRKQDEHDFKQLLNTIAGDIFNSYINYYT